MNQHCTFTTPNINSLNSPRKTQLALDQKTLLHPRNTFIHQRQASSYLKGWTKLLQTNAIKKQADEAILISNKVDFKQKLIRTDRE